MHTTNSADTFIAVAPDSIATRGTVPEEKASPSVALRTLRAITAMPYRLTSDDVLFTVFADRRGIPPEARAAAREEFFSKPQACLRASALGKKYGWGIHSDAQGRVAVYGVETEEYREFVAGVRTAADGQPLRITYAMRSSRSTR